MDSTNSSYFPDKPWLPSPDEWKNTWRDDWRIMGQEGYLLDKVLIYIQFDRSLCIEDFDKCEFCSKAFDEGKTQNEFAYFEPNNRVWICKDCFNDFKDHFRWTVHGGTENS